MSCVACKNKTFKKVYNFGEIPLVNNFNHKKSEAKKKYKLDIVYCGKCYLVQIRKNVDPKILFKNYKHISSGSKFNVNHLKSISKLNSSVKRLQNSRNRIK